MPQFRSISPLTLLASACVAFLCSCATTPGADRPSPTSRCCAEAGAASEPAAPRRAGSGGQRGRRTSAAAARPAAAPSGPPLPPFATVTQGARRIDGMLTLWQKDDKVWLELKPEDFNKPMFFSPKISQGLGEGGLYGGTMLRAVRAPGARRRSSSSARSTTWCSWSRSTRPSAPRPARRRRTRSTPPTRAA